MVAEMNRRGLITGLISFVAAPAIVRASSLMPVKAMKQFDLDDYYSQIFYPMLDRLKQTIISQYCYMEDGSLVVREVPFGEFYK